MKIGYLVFNLDGMGGTSRSAITQANALAGDHQVTLLSVTRSGDRPHYEIDERTKVQYLVDVREGHDQGFAPHHVRQGPDRRLGGVRAEVLKVHGHGVEGLDSGRAAPLHVLPQALEMEIETVVDERVDDGQPHRAAEVAGEVVETGRVLDPLRR